MPNENGGTSADGGSSSSQGGEDTRAAAEPTNSNDDGAGSSASAGMDTPLDPSVHGGKYKTVGELSKATSELHNQLGSKTDPNNSGGEDPEKPAPEPPRALTHEDLDIRDKQNLEQKNFDDSAKHLGLTEPQKEALADYGEREKNAGKAWPDLALELGFTTENRVAQARGMNHDERGGGVIGGGNKDPSTATTVKEAGDIVDNMSDDEFDAHVDKMSEASKSGNLR